jgi:hypothetical protein
MDVELPEFRYRRSACLPCITTDANIRAYTQDSNGSNGDKVNCIKPLVGLESAVLWVRLDCPSSCTVEHGERVHPYGVADLRKGDVQARPSFGSNERAFESLLATRDQMLVDSVANFRWQAEERRYGVNTLTQVGCSALVA